MNAYALTRVSRVATLFFTFSGDFTDEEALLEWLVHNRNSGEENEVIEEVDAKALEAMVHSVENLAVLFCKYIEPP